MKGLRRRGGFTLTELLITLVLVTVVFLGASSLYTTGLKFLRARQNIDVSTSPGIVLEQIVKKAAVANSVSLTQANTQLNLRIDYDLCSDTRAVPTSTTADDNWWHYRLVNNQLLFLCDAAAGSTLTAVGNPPNTIALMSNVDTTASTFQIINPSASGTATVLSAHLVSSSPAQAVDTEVSLGAMPKR